MEMGAIKLGPTVGRVAHGELYGARIRLYRKPSIGMQVVRKSGVIRRSEKVLAINRKVKADPPAPKCKDKPWFEFIACLSEEMAKTVA